MAVTVTHATQSATPDSGDGKISSDAWNESHTINGLGSAAEADTTDFAAASHDHVIADVTGLQTALDGKQAALGYTPTSVTGLTGTQSVAAFKTGLSLVKGDVGLGNVDNTSDANKPVSTATQTALNLKADTSGLGYFATGADAANLTGTVAAARLPALSGGDVTSPAGSAVLTIGANKVTFAKFVAATAAGFVGASAAGNFAQLTAAQAKTVLAITASDVSGLASVATSGSASDLSTGTLPAARLIDDALGCFQRNIAISGGFIDLFPVSNLTAIAGVADRWQLIPWTPQHDVAISAVGVDCSTALAASNVKITVHSTDATTHGPGALIKETGSIATATTGYKSEAWSYTFLKGIQYWVGVRTSGTQTLRANNASQSCQIGRTASSGGGVGATAIQKTLSFATGATTPFGAVATADLVAASPYAVILTLA